MWVSFPASEVCYPLRSPGGSSRLTRPPHPGWRWRYFVRTRMGARLSRGPGSSRNGAAIRLLLRDASAWIRAIQAENLASGTTSGMTFCRPERAGRDRVALSAVRRASTRAIVRAACAGRRMYQLSLRAHRCPRRHCQVCERLRVSRRSRLPGRGGGARSDVQVDGADAARIVRPRIVKSSIHSR